MSKELIDILSHSNKDIDNQKLMDYLSNKLSKEDRTKMEKMINESVLLKDAIEGLTHFRNKNNLPAFVDQLNADLQKQLKKKKQRKQKRMFKNEQ
jgi:hypothetical protein